MCVIKIMESILGSTVLVVNSCENISVLRQSLIRPEAVTPRSKQADPFSRMYDIYRSIDSGMSLVHVYRHQNIGNPASTLMPLAYLNVRLDAQVEHIMVSFLILTETRNTIAVGFSDPFGLNIVSIHGVPVHSNLILVSFELTSHNSNETRIRLLSTWNTSSRNVWVTACIPRKYYRNKDTQQPTSDRDIAWIWK